MSADGSDPTDRDVVSRVPVTPQPISVATGSAASAISAITASMGMGQVFKMPVMPAVMTPASASSDTGTTVSNYSLSGDPVVQSVLQQLEYDKTATGSTSTNNGGTATTTVSGGGTGTSKSPLILILLIVVGLGIWLAIKHGKHAAHHGGGGVTHVAG